MRHVRWKGGAISLPERVLSIVFGIASTASSLDCLLRHRSEGSFIWLFLIPNSSSTKEHSDSSSTKEHSRQQLEESPTAARRKNSPQLDESPTAARRKSDSSSAKELSAARRKSDSSSKNELSAARWTNTPQLDERTLRQQLDEQTTQQHKERPRQLHG